MIKMIDDENKELHILGDLNCNMLTNISNQPTKTLKGILETYQLSQLITEATRITTSSCTLIDHYITSMPEKIVQSGVIHTGISDHSLIYGIRKINPVLSTRKKAKKVEVRNMKRFNEERFNEDLLTQSWEQIVLKSDTDSMWACWKELFLEVLDKHAPIQHIRKRSSSVPWVTADIKKLIFERDKKKRKAMITKQSTDWDVYKTSRNLVNIALRHAKAEYYRNKIAQQNNNPKEAWKTINDLLGRSSNETIVNELKINDSKITSNEEIANAFNEYFTNIGPSLVNSIDESNTSFKTFVKSAESKMDRFKLVSVGKVVKLLKGLSNCKAAGLDKISGKILKVAANTIAPSLTHIFNHGLISNCFPYEWKMARLVPIHKKGPRNLTENYRPISILPAISKIMERIMYDQIYQYLSDNSLLSEHQFGFRKFHSTASALLDSTNSWYVNMDRKKFNLVVLLDLKKAFDTIDHGILLSKLELYGITGSALSMIRSYLTDRNQKCQLGDLMSTERRVTCGIPQGSILGPLFFLVYINDLPECLNQATPRLFADDTNLTVAGESIQEIELNMNSDLACINEWLLANKLSLNVTKTEFILIGSAHKLNNLVTQPDLKINHKKIKQVCNATVLGVELDDKLSWNRHIDKVAKKVTSGIGAIRKIRDCVDRDTLISIYNALINPHFDYCSEVWDTLGVELSNRLQKLQNRAARVIMNFGNDISGPEAIKALGWETLETRRAKSKAKTMYKVLNNLAPSSLAELFEQKRNITQYDLRGSSTSLQLPQPKTEKLKKSFSYDGARVWNSLPADVRNSDTLTIFKNGIRAHTS